MKNRFKIVWVGALFCALIFLSGCSKPENSKPKLNDTGITWGGNYPKDINQDCSARINVEQLKEGDVISGEILAYQDCTSGRDVSQADNSDGDAGFSYRKLNYDGAFLPANAENWFCVLDEISGLAWEIKLPSDGVYGNQGLHDSDDMFTWYYSNKSANGGAIGDWNDRMNQCTGYTAGQPMTYCNIEEFTNRVNQEGLCGFRDWRVPTRPELESLVHFGRTMPAIDIHYFPNTRNQFYWSLSPTATHSSTAWAVSFQFGFSGPVQRTNGRYVRLVRQWTVQK